MWERLNRLIKNNGVICLFGTQPFVTNLIYSNIDNYKYNWYWKKSKQNGFAHSKNKPMRIIEEICIFSKAPIGHKSQLGDKRMEYNPQGIKPNGKRKITESNHCGNTMGGEKGKSSRPNQVGVEYESYTNFPNDFLEYKSIFGKGTFHPTQKPVDLLEYLIKTYTNENEIVLDFTMGSGSTGVACLNCDRKFIGIELNEDYFNIAINRIFENYK
jgi:site-specific DNA-methyltransferase (adenine-specific)